MSKDSRYYLKILEDGRDKEFNFYTFDSFTDIILIGTGGFGQVYRANYKDANMLVALKSYEVGSNLKEIVNEIKIQKTVDIHDNIIRFLGVTKQEGDNYLLVLQWASNGTLRDYLEKNFVEMNWKQKLQFAIQLSSAVNYLHSREIIHPDFGLSRWITTNSRCHYGVLRYVDPQAIINSQNYKLNKKSDVYSVGMLMWELSSGQIPFRSYDDKNIPGICLSGIREKVVEGTPIGYFEIYQQCWQNDPDLRPMMSQVFDKLKKINLNSPVSRITDSTVPFPCIDSRDIELCIGDFFTNIIEQNHNISLQYEDNILNSQATNLWNILVKLTNIGKDFTQISNEMYHKHSPRIIKEPSV
ncbi:3287_t:CDS:2 [Cetraspora pellucida]|uniref:3287_t:CDS:1 n=1 Tax=Cetraspora pellucida TaxID=1433469 RepID=A0ACA9L215_9GLOM|nr:3287_t:CDS:2 [Cetraspora pellucida]